MRKSRVVVALIVTAACSAAAGYFVADIQDQKRSFGDRRENYTDRGRICIEAAAMIRNGDSEAALRFLEGSAVHAIRGVPMGADYVDLLPKSQTLLVSAKRYETTFPDAKFDVARLAADVPNEHPDMSPAVRTATSPSL